MYVVTEDGKKLPVDSSAIDDDSWIPFQQTVGLYTNNAVLKDIWILELQKSNRPSRRRDYALEFVCEIRYNHEPTKEEILWAMSSRGLSRYDVAFVRKGFELDMESD